MIIQKNDIIILFKNAKPEHIIDKSLQPKEFLTFNEISESLYLKYAKECYPNNSENEMLQYFFQLEKLLISKDTNSFFKLMAKFASDKIIVFDFIPTIKFDSILEWRNVSHQIGEDILVTSFLAQKSLEENFEQPFFDWSTNLKSNNRQLQNILNNGISENHYHLNGSTQIFPISWVSLMNRPSEITWRVNKIKTNLSPSLYFGTKDNRDEWHTLLKEAARIRVNLFCKIHHEFGDLKVDGKIISANKIQKSVSSLTFFNAYKARETNCFLDYALLKNLHSRNYKNNRILVGERKFLYDCFKASFSNHFSQNDNNDFYKYLLIKSAFRSEMIQNNHTTGFKNFSNYQNRKALFISGIKKYETEAIRTALVEPISTQPIVSLEARIMPCDNIKDLTSIVETYDVSYCDSFANNHKQYQSKKYPYSFILHYPKGITDFCFSKDKYEVKYSKKMLPIVRNSEQRKKYKIFSLVTVHALNQSNYLKKRIVGIDACSNEIGCRPEVFATEYRFIQNYKFSVPSELVAKGDFYTAFLGRTYHVGEDFLDIVDGLRAIDEVIQFLDFSHGDRLGHALALGISPSDYYKFKNNRIVLSQQDALDNLVWVYNKSNEMNIDIEPILKQKIEFEIHTLANKIYGNLNQSFPELKFNLDAFSLYCSWKLRGDNPKLYQNGHFTPLPTIHFQYDRAMYKETIELRELRKRKDITAIYYAYHYDYDAKKEGEIPYEFFPTPEYISLVEQIQKKMQFEVASHGIMIECNPSSNCLISTFKNYENHPIISFNNLHLESDHSLISECPQLSVSINTDDKGVFDTSLEYEFALMAAALIKVKDENGKLKYSISQVYEYLDNIRKMGVVQSFKVQSGFANSNCAFKSNSVINDG